MPIAKAGGDFVPASIGSHQARCFGCVSLGTQHSDKFADAFKVLLMFELPNEMIETDQGAKPSVVSKEYTLSIHPKSTLGQHLSNWRGRPFTPEEMKRFEVSNVVGAPCMVSIIHKTSASGKVRADITSIMGLPKGQAAPPQWHPSVKYEIEHGKNEVFEALPEWIKKKILACEEWQPSKVVPVPAPEHDAPAADDGADSDVPF